MVTVRWQTRGPVSQFHLPSCHQPFRCIRNSGTTTLHTTGQVAGKRGGRTTGPYRGAGVTGIARSRVDAGLKITAETRHLTAGPNRRGWCGLKSSCRIQTGVEVRRKTGLGATGSNHVYRFIGVEHSDHTQTIVEVTGEAGRLSTCFDGRNMRGATGFVVIGLGLLAIIIIVGGGASRIGAASVPSPLIGGTPRAAAIIGGASSIIAPFGATVTRASAIISVAPIISVVPIISVAAAISAGAVTVRIGAAAVAVGSSVIFPVIFRRGVALTAGMAPPSTLLIAIASLSLTIAAVAIGRAPGCGS